MKVSPLHAIFLANLLPKFKKSIKDQKISETAQNSMGKSDTTSTYFTLFERSFSVEQSKEAMEFALWDISPSKSGNP